MQEEIKEILSNVEFLHGVPVTCPKEVVDKIIELNDKALEQERQRIVEEILSDEFFKYCQGCSCDVKELIEEIFNNK